MTGVEIILLLVGSVFMVGSFFIAEKLSPAELNKIAELSESELKNIIDRGLLNAGTRIEDVIDEQVEACAKKVDRSLEKETNAKIMAISEYSDTVIESMNKSHNEIMFLYSMLNDKHAELTGMASEMQRLAADMRAMQECAQVSMKQPVVIERMEEKTERLTQPAEGTLTAEEVVNRMSKQPESENKNGEILSLYREGLTEIQIAKRLRLGIGEVRLVVGLYRGE